MRLCLRPETETQGWPSMALGALSQVAQETQESSSYSSLYTISFSPFTQSIDFGHMGHLGQEEPNCVRRGNLRVSQAAAGGASLLGHP